MISIFNKFTEYFNKAYMSLAILSAIGVVSFCFLQFFTRFVTKSPILGLEELSRLCFVWMVYFGVGICTARGTHASVTIFRDALPARAQIIHYIIIQLLGLFLAYVMFYYGIVLVSKTHIQNFGSLSMSVGFSTSCVIGGGLGIGINSINNILQGISKYLNFGKENKEDVA